MRIAPKSNSFKTTRRYLNNKIKNIKATDVDRSVCWVMPMSFVPALRTIGDRDKDKRTRKELFLRDLSAYTGSCLAFYTGSLLIAKKAIKFKPIAKKVKQITSKNKLISESVLQSFVGGTCSVLWSSFGALKLSKAIANRYRNDNPYPVESFRGAINKDCFKEFNKGFFNTTV